MPTCPLCGGSGVSPLEEQYGDPPTNRKCPVCFGNGSFEEAHGSYNGIEAVVLTLLGIIRSMQTKQDDMDDKLDDIMNKCNDIFEQVTE